MTTSSFDFRKALRDPTSVFRNPKEVLQHPALSQGRKAEVLRRWKYEAITLQIATDENMSSGSGDEDQLLAEILEALRTVEGQNRN